MDILQSLGWQEITLRLGCAVVVGGVLGLNRELRGKAAGLRTNALVGLGSALLMLTAIAVSTGADGKVDQAVLSRTIQGIITGIGFLGAGVIIRDASSTKVHGLTTAALIWLVSALGILCGVGVWPPVLVGTGFTLLILVVGRPLEKALHRWLPKLTEKDHDPID
jgi:putative Mg2+ transporter-C (MgtC) family protein